MSAARWVLLAGVVALLALSGCGGDGDSASSPPPSNRVVTKANAICRDALAEAKHLGSTGIKSPPDSDLDLVTRIFVKPGIPILERQARRLRRLEPKADSPEFSAYVDLYDPAIELSRQRLRAARKGNIKQTQNIQKYMEQLGPDSLLAARRAGLTDCGVDFQRALVHASSQR
jgi:hypothetical protein